MAYNKAAQIAEAYRHVGFTENPPGSNRQPWTAWHFYGRLQNLSWCASFFCWCCVQAAGFLWPRNSQNGVRGDAYVPWMVDRAKQMGIWYGRSTRAREGWGVVEDWEHNGRGDHVEVVIRDDGNRVVTIGGNTDNGVRGKLRDRKYILGFIALDEAGQNTSHPTPPPDQDTIIQEMATRSSNMLVKGQTDKKWRPPTLDVINGQLFAFNVEKNPLTTGTLIPFGKAHIIDLGLQPGERVQGILRCKEEAGVWWPEHLADDPKNFIAMTLLESTGELAPHALTWR